MKWKESGMWENPPAGSHIARCVALIDLGTQPHTNIKTGEKWTQRDVRLMFELPNELMEGKYNPEVKGKPFAVLTTMKQSLHPASALRKFLEGWRGRKFDSTSIEQFDPKSLVLGSKNASGAPCGLPCRLNLIEGASGYINIQSVSRLNKNETCSPQVNPSVYFSLDEGEFDPKVLESLPEKTRQTIKSSPEYFNLTGGAADAEGPQEAPVEESQNAPTEDPNCPF